MRVWSWMMLGGVAVSTLAGCSQQHKVDPYTAAGLTRPTDGEAAANAGNEVWKVSGLVFHDTPTGGYWTFNFSPSSPNNPDYTGDFGRVAAADLVAQTAVPTRSPMTSDISIIIVRHGSLIPQSASVEFPPPTPKSARPNGADTQQGAPQAPALNSAGKVSASPV